MNQNHKAPDEPIFWGRFLCRWYVECDCFSSNHHPAGILILWVLRHEAFDLRTYYSQSIVGRLFLPNDCSTSLVALPYSPSH